MKIGSPSSRAARSALAAQQGVGGDAPGQDEAAGAVLAGGLDEPAHEGGDDRPLERGHEVAHAGRDVGRIGHGRDALALHVEEHRGLDAAEGEVRAARP